MVFFMNFLKQLILPLVAKRNDRGLQVRSCEGQGAAALLWPHHCPMCSLLCFFFRHTVEPLSFCSCTDGLCSFIHKGYTNFDLALHLQHVSDWDGGRVGGRWKRSGRLSYWPDTLTAPCASFLCSSVPVGPACFLLCMSVMTSTVFLLGTDTERATPQLYEGELCLMYKKETHTVAWTLVSFCNSDKCQLTLGNLNPSVFIIAMLNHTARGYCCFDRQVFPR